VVVSGAVEGLLDDAVLRRILREVGCNAGPIHIKNGKSAVLEKLDGYNAAARLMPWVVLVDLNGDAACAPTFVAEHVKSPSELLQFRVAVRQVEAWLLADAGRIARFLRVSGARLPGDPDSLENSKRAIVEIARHSRDRSVREEIIPSPGSGRQVGPGYVARMIEFVQTGWHPAEAAARSESLYRCLRCLSAL
jgi:hypothetical protein